MRVPDFCHSFCLWCMADTFSDGLVVGGRDGGSRRTATRGGAAAQRDLLEGWEALDAIGVAEWLALGRTVDVGNELAAASSQYHRCWAQLLAQHLIPLKQHFAFSVL